MLLRHWFEAERASRDEVGFVSTPKAAACSGERSLDNDIVVPTPATSPSRMQAFQSSGCFRDGTEILGPVEALARRHHGFPGGGLDAQLHAITIELDFVDPILAERRGSSPACRVGAR